MNNLKTEVTNFSDHAFKVDQKDISRLFNTISEKHKQIGGEFTVKIQYKLKNGWLTECSNMDELFREENVGNKRIVSVGIEFISDKNETSIHFIDSIEEKDKYALGYKIVSDNRDWAYSLASEIDERFEFAKIVGLGHLNLLRSFMFIYMFVISILIIGFIFIIPNISLNQGEAIKNFDVTPYEENGDFIRFILDFELHKLESRKELFTGMSTKYVPIITILGFISFVVLLTLILKIAMFFFPSYNFVWGEYEKRYNNILSKRNYVIWTIIVGFLISVAAGFFTSSFD